MSLTLADFGFPGWLRAAHWINVLFMGFLIRGGIQILASYPRLYWNRHSQPGTEWLKFTSREQPTDRVWITLDEEQTVSPLIAQPGGSNLGLGRHWHFFGALFWMLNGVVYVALLFITGEAGRLIPTRWDIFPHAWETMVEYLTFHIPPAHVFTPYDPLQQLAYASVVFLLAPFLIVTGAAQSPGIEAQYPWFSRLLGGRQSARSLHFLGLVAFLAFILIHTALVILTGFSKNMGDIVFGQHQTGTGTAVLVGLGIIAGILVIYALTSLVSLKQPRLVQHTVGMVYSPLVRLLSKGTKSHQAYSRKDLSPYFLVNGAAPESEEYLRLLWGDFHDYTLAVTGEVQHPLCLSLREILALPKQTQITQHNCIQGWSGVGEWGGVSLREIIARCQPKPNARYVVFRSFSNDTSGREYFETLDLATVCHPQAILAYEMNGAPLPQPHGAPLRLRAENQLGFKMVKWLKSIEFVESYHDIRTGQGGSREENKYYEMEAGI